jgi:hypothetical protein
MKLRNLLIYLIIFVVIGLFYYLYEVRLAEKEAELTEHQGLVYDLELDRVTALKYRADDTDFQMVRKQADEWLLAKPIETPADRWEVEGLIRRVLSLEKDKVLEGPVADLAEFGLDKPQVSLTLMAGDRSLAPTLFLGNPSPTGDLIYARLGESKEVFTLPSTIRQELKKNLYDFRDKSLVLHPGEKFDRLVIVRADGTEIELVNKSLRHWDLVKPVAGPADDDLLQKMIFRGLKARVQEFVTAGPDQAGSGFDQPLVTYRVFAEGRQVDEVVIGGKREKPAAPDAAAQAPEEEAGYWARTTAHQDLVVIRPDMAETLNVTLEDLKDRHLAILDRRSLWAVKIDTPDRDLKAEIFKEAWDVKEPEADNLESVVVDDFLTALLDLKYERLAAGADETAGQAALEKPDVVFELTGPDDKSTTIKAGLKPVQDNLIAVRTDDGPVMLVDREALLEVIPEAVRPADEPDKPVDEPDKKDK